MAPYLQVVVGVREDTSTTTGQSGPVVIRHQQDHCGRRLELAPIVYKGQVGRDETFKRPSRPIFIPTL